MSGSIHGGIMRFDRHKPRKGAATNFTTATRLLLDILNPDAPVTLRDRIGELRPGEWQEFIALAGMQQVRPLVHFNMKNSHVLEMAPREIQLELHESYLSNMARNLRLYHDLKQISFWLRDAGIPLIALKGAHLARDVYSNIALREMLDLDILVPRAQLVKASEVMASRGYHPYCDDCQDMEEWVKSNRHLVGLEKGRTTWSSCTGIWKSRQNGRSGNSGKGRRFQLRGSRHPLAFPRRSLTPSVPPRVLSTSILHRVAATAGYPPRDRPFRAEG